MHTGWTRRQVSGTIAVLAALLGCDGSSEDGGTARPGRLGIALAQTPAPLTTLDFRAVGLAWFDDTTLAVIDRDEQQIVLLGVLGGESRRGAGEGGGPGELEGAFMLLGRGDGGGDGDGSLLIGDMKARRVSEFDASLAFVRSARIRGMPLQLIFWDGDRVGAIWMGFRMGEEGMETDRTVGEVDLGTGETRERYSLYDPGTGLSRPDGENPFAPVFVSSVLRPDGLLLAGQSLEYRIVALDSTGVMRLSFGREQMAPVYLSEEEKGAARSRASRGAQGGEPPPGLAEALEAGLEEPRPYFGPNAFHLDAARRLWVVREGARADSTEVDVFDPGGTYQRTLVLRDQATALAFRGSRLAVLVTRTAPEVEGLQGIDLYRLEEAGN